MGSGFKHLRGRCECGGIRYSLTGPVTPVTICHCGQCRRTHGAPGPYTNVANEDLVMEKDETVRWYASSDEAERGFCKCCGSSLFFQFKGAAKISVSAGTLDLPTGLGTAGHIFTCDQSDYYAIDDGLPQHDGAWVGPKCTA